MSVTFDKQIDDELEYFGQQFMSSQVTDEKLNHQKKFQQKRQHKLNKYICVVFIMICLINLGWVVALSQYSEGYLSQLEDLQKWSQLISADNKIQNYKPDDYYWFSVSTRDLILNSDLQNVYKRDRTFFQINRKIHFRSILLTQLTHNVNFQGQINVQLSKFQTDIRKKEKVIRLLMEYQKNYYQENYHITKYQDAQLPFCLIIPSYNNAKSKIYLRNLDSIFMQDYQNYHVVYIDDNSHDNTGHFVNQYINDKNIPKQKIKVIINDVNKKAMQNIYETINTHCKNGQIVGIVDGDDSLNGRQVLKLFNSIYHKKKLAFLYSNFLRITDNSLTEFGFGNQVTLSYFESGQLRSSKTLVCTHFMTFYVDLFKKAKKEDFQYQNGTFFEFAYDRAIITPLLQLSYPRNYYLPQMVYEYRHDTGINDGQKDWFSVSDIIQARPAYQPLNRFEFVDNNQIIKKGQALSNNM